MSVQTSRWAGNGYVREYIEDTETAARFGTPVAPGLTRVRIIDGHDEIQDTPDVLARFPAAYPLPVVVWQRWWWPNKDGEEINQLAGGGRLAKKQCWYVDVQSLADLLAVLAPEDNLILCRESDGHADYTVQYYEGDLHL